MPTRIHGFLLMLGLLAVPAGGQDTPADTSLVLQELIRRYDVRRTSRYVRGYRWDRIFHRREFHYPVTMVPLDVRYGGGFYGGGGLWGRDMHWNWLSYAAPLAHFDGNDWSARVYQQLDLDLAKLNLSQFLLNSSWLDLNTGFTVRYRSVLAPDKIPYTEWGQQNAAWNTGPKDFAPRILEAGISNGLILQWTESWSLNVRYVYSLAWASFYKTGKVMDSQPSATGTSAGYDVGFRYILDPGQRVRYTLGIGVWHLYTRLNTVKDPGDVTPITGMKLPGYGVYVSLSAFYGGRKTVGDLGKQYFYRYDFVTAREKLREFLAQYPYHANRKRAEELVARCEEEIPGQYYREGLEFERDDQADLALNKYRLALQGADSLLRVVIGIRLEIMAERPLKRAARLALEGREPEALELVRKTAAYSERAARLVPEYEARAAMYQGRLAARYGFFMKASAYYDQAVELQPELSPEVQYLRYQLALEMLQEANAIRDFEAIRLVVFAFEQARELTAGLSKESEQVLQELKTRLERYEEIRLQGLIDREMARVREQQEIRKRQLAVGMTIPEVQDLLGEPSEWIHKPNFRGKDYQLWIYNLDDQRRLELSFEEFILFKIEEL